MARLFMPRTIGKPMPVTAEFLPSMISPLIEVQLPGFAHSEHFCKRPSAGEEIDTFFTRIERSKTNAIGRNWRRGFRRMPKRLCSLPDRTFYASASISRRSTIT